MVCIGVIGSIYAIFGGLKAVALSDTINGYGLLIGGLLAGRLQKRAFYSVIVLETALLLYHAARFGQQYWVG